MFILPGAPPRFPDATLADDDGLLAVGGDLSMERLLAAYESGIFPWYDDGFPPMWWSPNPRAIIEQGQLHVSRSLRRRLRRMPWSVTVNRAFRQVMQQAGCSREEGTWILPEMIEAYAQLHDRGHAHSFEVWERSHLVGGLYGVQRGALFAAESMFHTRTDASKVALAASVLLLFATGTTLFDVQFLTTHLASMGAGEVSRDDYLQRLSVAVQRATNTATLSERDLTANLLNMLDKSV
jgi:leucyl/phenylalanyl-tRNA--protein transferase